MMPLLVLFLLLQPSEEAAIHVDHKARQIVFSGTLHAGRFNKGLSLRNHHFIVSRQGRASAGALIRATPTDTAILDALEEIGGTPGDNLSAESWTERKNAKHPDPDIHVEGTPVNITVRWLDGPELGPADLLEDMGGQGFAFRIGGHRRLIHEWRSGCVACLESCPGGRTSNAAYSMRDLASGKARFRLKQRTWPPDGTPVTITISLADEPPS